MASDTRNGAGYPSSGGGVGGDLADDDLDMPLQVMEDPMQLAREHTPRAIARLAELMECNGRQSMVAAVACQAMVKLAYPDMDEERVKKLVEAKLNALIAEAERRRLTAAGEG